VKFHLDRSILHAVVLLVQRMTTDMKFPTVMMVMTSAQTILFPALYTSVCRLDLTWSDLTLSKDQHCWHCFNS